MFLKKKIYFIFIICSKQELDAKIEDAEKNLGETEIREANLLKAEYLSLIAEKVVSYREKMFF